MLTAVVTARGVPGEWVAASGILPGGLSPGGLLPSGPGVGWAVLGFGLGMLGGAAGRVLLRRLRRGTRVPPPWPDVAVGVPWAGVGGAAGAGVLPWSWAPLLLGAAWLAVVASIVDLRHHRLPDALTLPALPAALLLAVPLGVASVGRAAAGAAVLAGSYLLVHAVSPRSLGLGDVKLAAPVGALLAAASWPALLLGCALTAVVSAVMAGFVVARAVRDQREREPGVPVALPGAARSGTAEPGAPGGSSGAAGRRGGSPGAAGRRGGSPDAAGRPGGSPDAAVWRRGGGSPGPPAELPLGPPMLGSAWLVVFAAALTSGVSGAVGAVGGG
ncbi:hypothetical protein GCM10023215_20750 [Pseudonocardia yuanmonensis]|uniref:Prepilin type IV endopeptidase peptidase domain-containing protein n=1 Tax=Pseudonocardia yuanmonensis TaxID=1095914 RepID=A0ABP8WBB9_9PSEU